MVSQTNEQALETAIERKLTGTCLEDLKSGEFKTAGPDTAEVAETCTPFDTHHGYEIGYPQHFNPRFAVDEKKFWAFLENTQEKELKKLKRPGTDDWQRKILERLDRMIKTKGLLHLLKKGLGVDDAYFSLFYPAPVASSALRVKEQFQSNVFSATRQVHYSLDNPGESIDLVLFINGLAFSTLELKNPWTGQTARCHGQKQYRTRRDNKQPLLQFGRCLVHMAVDTDEVYMTTKLAGPSTFFLPFNKGHDQGAGNPPNPNGHKSAYLWEEVFSKASIANLLEHFVRLDGKAKDPLNKRTLFFPRYHQMDVVRKLVGHAAENGVGQTCLIQHSAGSGKSNSITWAAYQLIETYPQHGLVPGAKDPERPLFDSVIVVTDRRLLDKQLRETIREFCEVKNIIAPAYRAADLKAALEQGKKVIITTIQKFPFILDGISDLSRKNFAVIIDEAHSSQSGSAHDNMNRAMGSAREQERGSENEVPDAQDKILKAMAERKMRGNASYFAFTATPKNTTLEKFGVKQADGQFKPFHLYSMKQAIEEGFILDVLAVQALSRLNRSAPSLGKKTEDLFILDFFNSVEDIKTAFDRFYTATSLSRATDVNVLHELKESLDGQGVYEQQEVEEFVVLYFNNADAHQLSPFIDVAADRFNKGLELEDQDKADFKIKAKQFVKIYGQMAAIMPFEIIEWEKLFWFLKFLIPKLIVKDPKADEIDQLLNSVDLSSYGLQRVKLNHPIRLDEEETIVEPQNPNPRGAHGGDDEHDPLDEIIRNFNERWFQGWSATPQEQRIKFLSIADSIKAHPDFNDKYKNNPDAQTRILAFQKIFEDVMLKKRREELELYKLLAGDAAFKSAMQQNLRQIVEVL